MEREEPTSDEGKVDVFQKRRQSRRLSTQVHVIMTLRRMSLRPDMLKEEKEAAKEKEEDKGDAIAEKVGIPGHVVVVVVVVIVVVIVTIFAFFVVVLLQMLELLLLKQ